MKKLAIVAVMVGLTYLPSLASKPLPSSLSGDAQIVNSGSTNTQGYAIFVTPSGVTFSHAGTVPRVNGALSIMGLMSKGRISKAKADKFYSDIKAAVPLARLPVDHMFRSVSFGTSTYVKYNGQQTPDLSSPADARGQALAADVKVITAALGLKNLPRRPVGPMTPLVPGH